MAPRSFSSHIGNDAFNAESLVQSWALLHRDDGETLPKNAQVLRACVHFHNGEFDKAIRLGMKAGSEGITVTNKATCVYANCLQRDGHAKPELFLRAAQRAQAQQTIEPQNANAWFWQGYALGRYSQSISVTKALVQGLGIQVKAALEQTIALAPGHAAAHVALAAFHAEVIDKVGALVGFMAYGARKDTALMLFKQALQLHPTSAVALTEYARSLLMLEGDKRIDEAMALCERAAALEPMDAMQRLDVQRAQTLAQRELQGGPCLTRA